MLFLAHQVGHRVSTVTAAASVGVVSENPRRAYSRRRKRPYGMGTWVLALFGLIHG